MRRILFLGLMCAIAFAVNSVRCDEPTSAPKVTTAPKPSQDDIDRWIYELNAPEFATRETATRRLIAAGSSAADSLVKAAQTGSLETTCRIATILRTWYTSGKDELIEPAEVAFEQLVESKNRHIANRAVATLDQYATTIRQDRAIAQIKQLGGTVEELTFVGRIRAAGPQNTAQFMVILGRSWRGGEEGLKHLRRIASLHTLYLLQDQVSHKIVTPGLTQDSVDDLHRALPALAIVYRGPAFLGVKTLSTATVCKIDEVPDDSPAARAKLQQGDVIIQFEGQPVNNFEDLIKHIGSKQPGDVIKLEILRGCDDNDLLIVERLKELPDSNIAKEHFKKLRERMGQTVNVTLGEWGAKPKP